MRMHELESKGPESITSYDLWSIYLANHLCNDKANSLVSKSYFRINGSNIESKNVLTAPERERPECPFCSYCGVPPNDKITSDVVLCGL